MKELIEKRIAELQAEMERVVQAAAAQAAAPYQAAIGELQRVLEMLKQEAKNDS